MLIYDIAFTGKCKCQAENYEIADAKFNSWARGIEENNKVYESLDFELGYTDEVDADTFQITFYGGCRMKATRIEEAISYFRHWSKNFETTDAISNIVIDIDSIEKEEYGEEG